MNMNINNENIIQISETSQDFLSVARLVDEKGTALILKDNKPRYVMLDYSLLHQNLIADDSDLEAVALRILKKHIKAFEELAK